MGGNVRVVKSNRNQGFLKNCNQAAGLAKGRWLVFVNNDTLVLNHWLDELIDPFTRLENVGMVGSKLLSADGYLQEAGGILWKDGSAWNFGRGQDPRNSEFNYLKDVDYCSAASVAVDVTAWKKIGGFDEHYSPAYCEDSDLAFGLRELGYRTIYSPFSTAIHHEGVSHGTDVTTSIKSYQVSNNNKFVSKWLDTLQNEHFANGQNVFLARDRSGNDPHILVVDHYIPQPDRDAGSRTIWDYLRFFVAAGFQVTFWPENLFEDRAYVSQLQRLGIEVIYGPRFVGKFEEWIKEHGKYFEYAFLSRAHVCASLIGHVKKHSNAKVIFYCHDVGSLRLKQELTVSHSESLREELETSIKLEEIVWGDADVIYNPGELECEYIRKRVPGKIVRNFQPYIIDELAINKIRERLEREDVSASAQLIFVGGFRHRPNVNSILWFCRDVFDLIQEKVPGVSLYIVGSFPPPEVIELNSKSIIVTGAVSDEELAELYRSSTVGIAPLLFGGGVKGKIIEAMRHGLPIVTTSVGLQGIEEVIRLCASC